jgi:hypothetical protein
MKKELAKKILAEDPSYKIMEGYSGRYMYGAQTVAVEVPSMDDVGHLRKKYGNLRWDNLGLHYVVY